MLAKSLRTVAQLADDLPAFDQAAIRRLIFNAAENGLAPAIFRIGRRVLIDVALFNEWLEERRMRPKERQSQSQTATAPAPVNRELLDW